MTFNSNRFLAEHRKLTRRFFLGASAASATVLRLSAALDEEPANVAWEDALSQLEDYFTSQNDFRDVSRGNPIPHTLSVEALGSVGQTRDTWQLQVLSDPDNPARVRNPLTSERRTAFKFSDLMNLAKQHAVRFPKVMTCLNIGCPLGTGIWEGVPLREVLWLTQPTADLRRVYYHGFHNDEPEQLFRSSLPVGRVLEDPFDLPPVILCYKLNGQWLTAERGGPVRVVVPEAYGFKSIKWLSHVVLSNLYHANDTYADGNNDVDSALKTFAATLSVPKTVRVNERIPITGYAQVGISGLSKVQVWMQSNAEEVPNGDRYFSKAPWRDAQILGPPTKWGGGLLDDRIPSPTQGFDPETGKPLAWPIRLAKAHWATLLPGLPAGEYTLRCRTIDQNNAAQPMPRPFRKSGHNAIEQVEIVVDG